MFLPLPVSCSGDGVPSTLCPGHRAQSPVLGEHQRSGVWLHQRCGSGHGGKLPGKPQTFDLYSGWAFFFTWVQTTSLILLSLQVDHAKSLHYVGAGVAFPAGLLFVCLQCVLTYRVAVTALDYWMAHFRVALALGAMISLVLSIL